MLKPSDFRIQPWSSVFMKSEHETIARNCMVIQTKYFNDEWRTLTWEEYKSSRIQDGASDNWSLSGEQKYFDDVVSYTTSPERAASFSPTWKAIFKGV